VMFRPTLAETLAGIQRTILNLLLPELTSPYAQGQAAMAAADLAHVAGSLEKALAYDAAETSDLRDTLGTLKPFTHKLTPGVRAALEGGIRAADAAPPDRRAMEAAMAELASALALGQLDDCAGEKVRAYLRRYLDRARNLLQSAWGA
jgi:hypothetical protein